MHFDRFLKPGEKVILCIRRHPFAFISSILILAVMGILPVLLLSLKDTLIPVALSRDIMDWIAVGVGSYFLFFIVIALVFWIDYYYDLYVVTDKHLLDIDQTGLLSRRISHTSLIRVQDVTTRQRGFWQSLLDFGNITVQTAGREEDLLLEDVPHCSQVAAKIMQLHDELISREGRKGEVAEGEGVHPPHQ